MANGDNFNYLEVSFSALVGTAGVDRRVIFRDLEFDDTHDYGSVENIIRGMENSGWEIHNVIIHTDNDDCWPSIKDAGTLSAVFEALVTAPDCAGQIVAYGELFGWTESNFENSRYGRKCEDGYYGVFDSVEDFAQEFVENDEELSSVFSHPYISINWEQTAHNLMNDFCDFEYGYEIYIFANH